eukprot:3415026-Rhodomonas_salina.1
MKPPADGEEEVMMPDRERKQKQEKPDDGGEAAKKYLRGDGNKTRGVTDRKLKMQIKRDEAKIKDAAAKAARAEILLPTEAGFLEAEGMEKTQRFTQKQIREAVDVGSAQKSFTLTLDTFGPYSSRYSRNGRHLLLGGKLGHIALCDWQAGKLSCEFHVKETGQHFLFMLAALPFMARSRTSMAGMLTCMASGSERRDVFAQRNPVRCGPEEVCLHLRPPGALLRYVSEVCEAMCEALCSAICSPICYF